MLLREQVFTVKSMKSLPKYLLILRALLQQGDFKLNNCKTASRKVDSELDRIFQRCIQTGLPNRT